MSGIEGGLPGTGLPDVEDEICRVRAFFPLVDFMRKELRISQEWL
jgi:hypothetical protein